MHGIFRSNIVLAINHEYVNVLAINHGYVNRAGTIAEESASYSLLSSITRFGNLGRVFKEGESDLLIGIARLAVLYEDLRLELDALRAVQEKPDEERTSDDQYRVMYFMRRGLATLIEFRGGLTTVRLTPEFKSATLAAVDEVHHARRPVPAGALAPL